MHFVSVFVCNANLFYMIEDKWCITYIQLEMVTLLKNTTKYIVIECEIQYRIDSFT